MAAWLNIFMLIGFARWAQIAARGAGGDDRRHQRQGLLRVQEGPERCRSPSRPSRRFTATSGGIVSAKSLLGALLGAVVLAVLVNTVELLCTAGLPAVYTQILTYQGFPAWKNYAYLGLYISAYMLDDVAMLSVVVVTLSRRRLQEQEGRYLKLLSGAVILALGVVMLAKPEWLA